jgi:hypothetical protein
LSAVVRCRIGVLAVGIKGIEGIEDFDATSVAYTSIASASSARSMMNRKRAEASRPINSLITRSVSNWSSISTR